LHHCAFTNAVDIVELLIASGGNPTARDLRGRTPYHIACQNGKDQVLKALIMYGKEKYPNAINAE